MPRLDADRFLEDLTGRHARHYTAALGDLLEALATGDRIARRGAVDDLEAVIAETMGTAEVLGASLVLQQAASVMSDNPQQLDLFADRAHLTSFADQPTQAILPRVTLSEALDDMVDRTPTTIRSAARRTAQNIARLYGEGSSGVARVAFVNSAEAVVTKRVQALIAQAIKEGVSEVDTGRRIVRNVDFVRKETAAWTESYSRMVFRTNVNTAVTAGRFRQVRDPDIKAVLPAFRFDSVGDADTRGNHDAADGLIMSVDNQAWTRIAPPLGYNCRCQVSLVSLPMLRRMGRVGSDGSIREDRVPASAGADAGFRHGGRPDLFGVSA